MVLNDAFNGDYVRNPFQFEHFHFNMVDVQINSEAICRKPSLLEENVVQS